MCCSPTWAPTSTGDNPTYPTPPTAEFTCEASYTAVAKAASCTQSGLSGYTFPATATTGAYECYPDDDVPTDSCAGTAVREFDNKAITCINAGYTWQECVDANINFLCTDHPNCIQIFVDRFNGASDQNVCPGGCTTTDFVQYQAYCLGKIVTSEPCFAAETTTACKLAGDVTAAEARRQCYDDTKGADAELVLMKDLAAGDVVLATDASGALSLERVIVNQHKANPLASALLELHHSAGVLALTPDHVLLVNGAFGPARDATPGSTLKLADGTKVVVARVTKAHGTVINPLTTSGTIVAGGVVASSHPEWTFAWAGKAPFPLFYGLAAAFPTTSQAYYDAVLEPLFDALGANLRPMALGASALVAPLALADAAAALGLGLFAGAAPAALATLALGVVTLRARKA